MEAVIVAARVSIMGRCVEENCTKETGRTSDGLYHGTAVVRSHSSEEVLSSDEDITGPRRAILLMVDWGFTLVHFSTQRYPLYVETLGGISDKKRITLS